MQPLSQTHLMGLNFRLIKLLLTSELNLKEKSIVYKPLKFKPVKSKIRIVCFWITLVRKRLFHPRGLHEHCPYSVIICLHVHIVLATELGINKGQRRVFEVHFN